MTSWRTPLAAPFRQQCLAGDNDEDCHEGPSGKGEKQGQPKKQHSAPFQCRVNGFRQSKGSEITKYAAATLGYSKDPLRR